jgi:galactose mutarotase-like enzyme
MSDENTWLTIGSAALTARIDPLGAQLSSLRDTAGHDLLWDGDPAFWSGRAPLLFPIVGSLAGGAYRLDGKTYALPRHGFARHQPFEVLHASADEVQLRLRPDEQTLAVYPFQFQLRVRFAMREAGLTLTTRVQNDGQTPMPASFGYHPAFRWPLPFGAARARHVITFERDEPGPIRRLDAAGLVTPLEYPSPVQARRLLLDDTLFSDDVVIFAPVHSQAVSYGADSGPQIEVRFPETPLLGLWSRPGAPFVCIEPWHGMSDPVGYTGDFAAKPGVFMVPPAGYRDLTMQVVLAVD